MKKYQKEIHTNYSIKKIKAIDKKNKIKKVLYTLALLLFSQLLSKNISLNSLYNFSYNKKRVGVVCIEVTQNVGNILVKYSMFKKLEELGFNVTIISPGKFGKTEFSFINPLASPGEEVSVFTYPYLSAGPLHLAKPKG